MAGAGPLEVFVPIPPLPPGQDPGEGQGESLTSSRPPVELGAQPGAGVPTGVPDARAGMDEARARLNEMLAQQTPEEALAAKLAPTPETGQPSAYDRAIELAKGVSSGASRRKYGMVEEGARGSLEGFNTAMANTLGLPVEIVNEALGHAGHLLINKGSPLEPGEATKFIRDSFRHFGVNAYEGEAKNFMNKVGEEGFRQILFAMGMRAAGPTLANAPRGPVQPVGAPITLGEKATEAARAAGQTAVEYPGTLVAGGALAAPGMVAGADVLGPAAEAGAGLVSDNPAVTDAARQVGEMTGQIIGGTTTAVPGVAILRGIGALPRIQLGGKPPLPPSSIASATADPMALQVTAQRQVERATSAIDKQIVDTINGVGMPEGISPAAAATWQNHALNALERASNEMVAEAYKRIPQQTPISPDKVLELLQQWKSAPQLDRTAIPTQLMKDILGTVAVYNEHGQLAGIKDLTLHDMRSLRNRIRDARMGTMGSAVTGVAPNRALAANLTELERTVMESINDSLRPIGMTDAWAYARAMYRNYADRFLRGPLAPLFRETGAGQERVHPRDTTRFLLNQTGGFDAMAQATRPLPSGQVGSGAPYSFTPRGSNQQITPQTPEGASDVMRGGNVAIRTQFVDAARERASQFGTPKEKAAAMAQGGEDFMTSKVRAEVTRFTEAATRIDDALEVTRNALRQRSQWEKSAIAQFTDKDPASAVKAIMASANPAREVRTVLRGLTEGQQWSLDTATQTQATTAARERAAFMRRSRATGAWEPAPQGPEAGPFRQLVAGEGDADAVAGLGRLMVENLLTKGQSAEQIALTLSRPNMRRAFDLVLGPQKTERLQRVVDNIVALEKANASGKTSAVEGTAKAMAVVAGNLTGHGIAAAVALATPGSNSYGKLAYPARMTRKFSAIVASMFDKGNPAELLTEAVFNPEVERLLNTKLPSTNAEALAFSRQIRRLGISQSTLHDRAVTKFINHYQPDTKDSQP